MEKQTKNIITREMCQQRLISSAKEDLITSSILFILVTLIAVLPLVAFFGIFIMKYSIVAGIIAIIIFLIPSAVLICTPLRAIISLRLYMNGGFSIVKDTVHHKAKGEHQRYIRGGVDVIYFSNYGRFIASGLNFTISSIGDEFFLVIIDNKKKSIAMAFNAKMYEYK